MDKFDEYRKLASDALTMANLANDPNTRAYWLLISQEYLAMLPKPKSTAEQRFDAGTKTKGTVQEGSKDPD